LGGGGGGLGGRGPRAGAWAAAAAAATHESHTEPIWVLASKAPAGQTWMALLCSQSVPLCVRVSGLGWALVRGVGGPRRGQPRGRRAWDGG